MLRAEQALFERTQQHLQSTQTCLSIASSEQQSLRWLSRRDMTLNVIRKASVALDMMFRAVCITLCARQYEKRASIRGAFPGDSNHLVAVPMRIADALTPIPAFSDTTSTSSNGETAGLRYGTSKAPTWPASHNRIASGGPRNIRTSSNVPS